MKLRLSCFHTPTRIFVLSHTKVKDRVITHRCAFSCFNPPRLTQFSFVFSHTKIRVFTHFLSCLYTPEASYSSCWPRPNIRVTRGKVAVKRSGLPWRGDR